MTNVIYMIYVRTKNYKIVTQKKLIFANKQGT